MIRDFNTKEFLRVRHGMNDAKELLAQGYPKDALAALRGPKRILESKVTSLRMLALLYVQEAEILLVLKRQTKAIAALDQARRVLLQLDNPTDELFEKIERLRSTELTDQAHAQKPEGPSQEQ